MELKKYYFVSAEDTKRVVIPKIIGGNFEEDFLLIGEHNGEKVTSGIVLNINIEDNKTLTDENNTYKLQDMHPDFAKFIDFYVLKAQIIENWEFENIPVNTVITGICNGEKVKGKITGQDDLFIELDNDKRYLVNWSSMNDITKKRMCLKTHHNYYKMVDTFCDFKCIPILF